MNADFLLIKKTMDTEESAYWIYGGRCPTDSVLLRYFTCFHWRTSPLFAKVAPKAQRDLISLGQKFSVASPRTLAQTKQNGQRCFFTPSKIRHFVGKLGNNGKHGKKQGKEGEKKGGGEVKKKRRGKKKTASEISSQISAS